MTVVTRFAPSPTGFLHIGGARTALFNYLYAKHTGGKFLLRIEDTDRERSTQEAFDAIQNGMKWLGLDWDGELVSQFQNAERHAEVAQELLAKGKAYKCTCTPEELAEMREKAKAEGRSTGYDGRCRDKDHDPQDGTYVVRIKAQHDGDTVIEDLIQGQVTVSNSTIDDFVILRTDGSPTYMLAVVVDDHDMGITHVVRGDDHLTNAFRQMQIYDALGWERPVFAHMPLLHGADGKKLSKRHGALGVEAYRDMGLLPEAVNNYLLRLGWSHGDDEIISQDQAIEWFDVVDVGKAAARFDADKLTHVNGHYMREADDQRLLDLIWPLIEDKLGDHIAPHGKAHVLAGMSSLKERAKTTLELAENAAFYAQARPLALTEKAAKLVSGDGATVLQDIVNKLNDCEDWQSASLQDLAKAYGEKAGLKLGKVAQPLRAALTGTTVSPSVFEILEILGKEESLGRLTDAISGAE
ncbi:glutamate--tRNA ligase [Magnetovibrio sp. PR-2]|uniref:glutamate--tRNA ligase n=1 Tax=Magnetovibrio sp. PR-2 TaxID=3120356 RepID=UPI002FCE3CD7